MSNFGFLAKNQFGYTQVDGVYQNMSGIYSGSIMCNEYQVENNAGQFSQIATSQLNHSATGREFSVNSISNFPSGVDFLVFAKPSSSAASGTKNIGIYWLSTTSFIFVKESTTSSTDTSFSVDFIIAIKSKDMPTNSNPDYGLRVRAPNGDDVFNSNNQNFAVKGYGYNTLPSTLFYWPASDLQDLTDFTVDLSDNDIYADLTSKSVLGLNNDATQGAAGWSKKMHYLMHEWDYTNDVLRTVQKEVNTRDDNLGSKVFIQQVWGRNMFHLIGTFL